MLMAAPKSTKALGKERPFICTVTMGFPWASYLTGVPLPSNKSDKVPMTWIVGVIFVFLTDFFSHNSLMVLAYIGMSLMA